MNHMILDDSLNKEIEKINNEEYKNPRLWVGSICKYSIETSGCETAISGFARVERSRLDKGDFWFCADAATKEWRFVAAHKNLKVKLELPLYLDTDLLQTTMYGLMSFDFLNVALKEKKVGSSTEGKKIVWVLSPGKKDVKLSYRNLDDTMRAMFNDAMKKTHDTRA